MPRAVFVLDSLFIKLDYIHPFSLQGLLNHFRFSILDFFFPAHFLRGSKNNDLLECFPLKLVRPQCLGELVKVCNSPTEVCFEIPSVAFSELCLKGLVSPEWDITARGQNNSLIILMSLHLPNYGIAKVINNASLHALAPSSLFLDLLSERVHVYSADEWESNYLI